MKHLPLLLLGLLLSACASTPNVATYEGYELVWNDEFNTDGPLNSDDWGYEQGFVRNHELQYYTPEQAIVADGNLVITAIRTDEPNPNHEPGSNRWQRSRERITYRSASVNTRGKHEFLYGRVEVRAKLNALPGLWPAIWTLGSARSWPGCGEIDIMEYYDGKILANAAWAGDAQGRRWAPAVWDGSRIPVTELGDPQEWSKQFHTWRMDWTPDTIHIYLDGRLLNEVDLTRTLNHGSDINPFREPHYLLLNLAIGGHAGGDPSNTDFPQQYLIDYVRIYRQTAD